MEGVPTTSPFYRNCISPICDVAIAHIDPAIPPDAITVLGLILAFLSIYMLPSNSLVAALLWIGYAICDNLDGKHARNTNQTSPRGEFLDHVVDSATCVLLSIILSHCLLHQTSNPIITIFTQIPFLLASWYYHNTGKVLLGPLSLNSGPMITVDEVNFISVPILLLGRPLMMTPVFGESVCVGQVLMMSTIGVCCYQSYFVIDDIWQRKDESQAVLMAAGVVYLAVVGVAQLDPIVVLPVFAWLCSCLMLPNCYSKVRTDQPLLDLQVNPIWPVTAILALGLAKSSHESAAGLQILISTLSLAVISLDLRALSK